MNRWIVGWDDKARVRRWRSERRLFKESVLQRLRYVVLPYRGERFESPNRAWIFSRVVFLSGLSENLALYAVSKQETSHAG